MFLSVKRQNGFLVTNFYFVCTFQWHNPMTGYLGYKNEAPSFWWNSRAITGSLLQARNKQVRAKLCIFLPLPGNMCSGSLGCAFNFIFSVAFHFFRNLTKHEFDKMTCSMSNDLLWLLTWWLVSCPVIGWMLSTKNQSVVQFYSSVLPRPISIPFVVQLCVKKVGHFKLYEAGVRQFPNPVLNWANVYSPNILQTLRRTMIRFLIELFVRRIWFG